jgi:hypothetical protein
MTNVARSRYLIDFIMEIIITGCWSLWDQRNSFIFNRDEPSVLDVYLDLKITATSILHRDRPSLKEGMQAWLDTL